MTIAHTQATAVIKFTGLGFLNFSQQPNQCRIGIMKCKNHDLYMDIQETSPERTTVILSSQKMTQDITFDLSNGSKPGASAFRYGFNTPGDTFNRAADTGDPEDLRWITDLSSSEFHNAPLTVKSVPSPMLYINQGTVYTAMRTDYRFARVTRSIGGNLAQQPDPVFLGRIGLIAGVDIVCPDNASVILTGKDFQGGTLPLPKKPGAQYTINITNDCDGTPVDPTAGTDFLMFYDFLQPPIDQEFDLAHAVDNGGNPGAEPVIPNTGGRFSLDGHPENCGPSVATTIP
ncbi:MAG TPA: hypothetical protein VJX67_22690 [Blastocatellia bacterium]|nr:hypothetical protein [Blastocatellia bacterium]